jgi:hypothetical protein
VNVARYLYYSVQFLAIFGSDKIDYLTADREFIGEEWFRYLINQHIEFRLRIKKNMKLSCTNGQLSPAMNFFRSLPVAVEYSFRPSKSAFSR